MKRQPLTSRANKDFLVELRILAGHPLPESNLDAEERLHLITHFFSLRGASERLPAEGVQAEMDVVERVLCARGANEKAARLIVQRVAWEQTRSLIALADDVSIWPELKRREEG